MNRAGFQTTRQKGVAIALPNGWTVSVQWGPGNLCENMDQLHSDIPWQSPTAEVAIWCDHAGYNPKTGELCGKFGGVEGWVSPERFAEILAAVAKLAPQTLGVARDGQR